VNPVYPDYFVVFKSEVVHSKFQFKNYINQEDRENVQKTMNHLRQNIGDDEDSDINEDLIFEKAIAMMRKEKEYNIGKLMLANVFNFLSLIHQLSNFVNSSSF
jgi:hypothetical protein